MGIWEKIVEFLVGTVGQSAVDAWRQNSAVDSDISVLRSALLKAHLLIQRSECWRLPKYYPIDKLVPELKDAVYEAESLVDEFVYQGLKNEVEKNSTGTTFLRNWMRNFPAAVEKAFNRLDKISNEMKETCDIRGIPENPNKFSETARPITTTSLDTTNTTSVYGRDKELNQLFSRMGVPRSGRRRRSKKVNIGESSDNTNKNGNVSVFSIVGIGGVGKTTLAQMACNDKSVKSYFDLIIWVCVSDNSDLRSLTKEIIEGAIKKGCDDLANLNALQMNLEEILNSKRFLLVLDDVWSKDWQHLLGPMKRASEGSIVLVTTRSHQCVDIAARGVINLEGLEEHIYWKFFKSCAFVSRENLDSIPELGDIAKEICGRLKGSPLAAKTIGGLLRTNMDVRHWMKIRDSKMWQLKQEERDILPVLQLSYQYLPSNLKRCFSYCALYPKDFKFKKWELTKLWIMQGFINLPSQLEVHWKEPSINEAEDLSSEPFINEAEGYFNELIQRCFFQKAVGRKSSEYVIHDLMHDLCQSITKDECFCTEKEYFEKSITSPNYTYVRHLSVFQERIKLEGQLKLSEYEKLFSVMVGPRSRCCFTAIDHWCMKLTSVRSLSLSRCKIDKLPVNIGRLEHLQYLDISFTKIERLPESLCNLYNLLYLNLEGCSKIISIPEKFNKLVNLRFLYWPADKIPLLLGHLENNAREIVEKMIEVKDKMFYVSDIEKLESLKYLEKLSGKLIIRSLENVPNKKAAEEARLKDKSLVRELDLSWSNIGFSGWIHERHDEAVFQGLCPHPNLEVLKIEGYGGRTLPSWFKKEFFPNLTEIRVEKCKRLTNLQDCLVPNHFPMLKIIMIITAESLVSLPVESFGGFVFLQELKISDCPKLTCSSNALVLPPSIKYLELDSCGEVEKSIFSCLQNLTSLETLEISNCSDSISITAEEVSNLKSLKKLEVTDCERLQLLGGLKFLTSLEKLSIYGCPDLASILDEEASNLKSLRILGVEDCAKLQSLGGLKCLASLEEVIIRNCPDLVSISVEEASNLKSLRTLGVYNCAKLQSLGGLKFLASLEELTIWSCPALVLSMTAEEATNMKSLKKLEIGYCAGLQSLGGLNFLASLEELTIQCCPKLVETGGRDIWGKLPSELLARLHSESGPEALEERSAKRVRN